MSDPECKRCGRRGYGNCPMSPPCVPHPLGPRCKKCGAGVSAGARCPERPNVHANVGGHGWRLVPNLVADCLRHQKGQDGLDKLISGAYARHRLREKILTDPDIPQDAGVLHPEAPKPQGFIEPEYLT